MNEIVRPFEVDYQDMIQTSLLKENIPNRLRKTTITDIFLSTIVFFFIIIRHRSLYFCKSKTHLFKTSSSFELE